MSSGHGCLVDFGLAQKAELWDQRRMLLAEHRERSSKRILEDHTLSNPDARSSLGRCVSRRFSSKAPSNVPQQNAHARDERLGVGETRALPKRPDRAGTPGFRAPEVLLYSLEQSSAIDVWSAGVIFISLLTRRYPFFQMADGSDETSLVQIASLMGPDKVISAAAQLNKRVELPSARDLHWEPSISDLFAPPFHSNAGLVGRASDLLTKALEPNPFERISASEALEHPFLSADCT